MNTISFHDVINLSFISKLFILSYISIVIEGRRTMDAK